MENVIIDIFMSIVFTGYSNIHLIYLSNINKLNKHINTIRS